MASAAPEPKIIDGDRVELVADAKYFLGEGAIWHTATSSLLHVDIMGKTVGLLNHETGDVRSLSVPGYVGTVVPVEGSASEVVVCLDSGAHRLNLDTGALVRLAADPESDVPTNRFNDGKCDPAGRLWAGTMETDPPRRPVGTLYRFDPAAAGSELPLVATPVVGEASISNGIVWPADGKTMLYIDTPTRRIDAFDYDAATGAVSGRREAFTFSEEGGFGWPDGCTLDSEGRVWTAHFGGSEVTCVDLPSRRLLVRVKLPVSNITSVAFGGPGLADLYITTAREGLDAASLEAQPTAGGIFRVRGVGATGLPPSAMRLP